MAIVFGGSVSGSITSGSTFAGTITPSGANLLLTATIMGRKTGGGSVTSMAYSSNTMTRAVYRDDPGNSNFSEIWYLQAPPSGLGTLNGTTTASIGQLDYNVAYFTGAAQSGVLDVAGSLLGTSGTASIGITPSEGSCLVIESGQHESSSSMTLAGSQIRLKQADAGVYQIFTSYIIESAAAAVGSFIWTNAASDTWNEAAASFKSASASGAGTNLIQSSGTAVLGLGSTSVTWPGNTTTGNLIVVGVNLTNAITLGTVSAVSDNQGNTYTRAIRGTFSEATSVINTEIWYAKTITGGAGSVTVSHDIDNCAMFAREYSGFNTLDVTNSANGSSTDPNSGTSSVTVAGTELVVVTTGDDKGATQTWTVAGNYGDMVGTATTLTGLSMEDNIVTSTGAQTGTLTLGAAANWESLLASFQNVVVSSSGPGYKSLLGVGQS